MFSFRGARRRGQGLSEYGLVLGLIAVVAIGALSSTGGAVSGMLGNVAGAVNSASNPCDFDGCANGCITAFTAAGGFENPDAVNAVSSCVNTCYRSYIAAACDSRPQEEV